jgi:hypothetical protein
VHCRASVGSHSGVRFSFLQFLTQQHSHSPSCAVCLPLRCARASLLPLDCSVASEEISSRDLHVRSRCLITQRPKRTPEPAAGAACNFADVANFGAFSKSDDFSAQTHTLHHTRVAALERGRGQPIDATNGTVGDRQHWADNTCGSSIPASLFSRALAVSGLFLCVTKKMHSLACPL